MADAGHVFVVQARLENLDHDAVVVPTDDAFDVTDSWSSVLGAGPGRWRHRAALRPDGWGNRRWGRAAAADGFEPVSPVWFVDVADYSGGRHLERDVDAMLGRLAAALEDIAGSDIPVRSGRPRPLVAVPTLGVGRGGFDAVRGRVVDGLLATCEAASATHGIDIALVAARPADHSAFQLRRRRSRTHALHLGDERVRYAEALADRAREGSLALFIGAGVSVGAGLPSWEKLLEMVAGEKRTADLAQLDSPLDRAEYLRRELGDQLGRKVSEITSGATRYGISHALLTALGCTEVVTTNYDDLYERAAADVDHPTVPVLPFDDPAPRTPWVLKMHGDQRDPRTIVLSRSDMVGYDARSRPMGSVVQALLLTRHLLVVGASMTDDNFLRLAHEVLAFRSSTREDDAADAPLGTVVTLTSSPPKQRLWAGRFDHVAAADAGTGTPEAARRLAIFLDAVAMYATPARHLADARYAYLLDDVDTDIAESCRELGEKLRRSGRAQEWEPLTQALVALGALPDLTLPAAAPTPDPPAAAPASDRGPVTLHDDGGLHVTASLRADGTIVISGQHLRNGSEYEYAISVRPEDVASVVTALGGSPGDDPLDALVAHRETVVRTGELTWLESVGVVPEFWSRSD